MKNMSMGFAMKMGAVVVLGVLGAGLLMNKLRGDYDIINDAHNGFDS